MIKAFSFDLDGTLVDRSYVDYFWLELIPSLYSERHGVEVEEAKRRVYRAYDEVGPDDARWYMPEYWLSRFDLEVGLEDLRAVVMPLVRPYPDTLETLERLRGRFKLALATNASTYFIDIVFEAVPQLRDSLDYVFSCISTFNMPRKSELFYRRILEELGLRPAELVHVGDDPVYDRDVPRALGVKAFFIDRGSGGDISSLTELLRLV